jgi:hypothetical protein
MLAGTHANLWSEVERCKMKLRSLTSAICRSDATTPVSYAWSRNETIISLAQPCFDRIVDFLRSFSPVSVSTIAGFVGMMQLRFST